MHKPSLLAIVALCLGGGCATTNSATHVPQPLPREKGKPVTISVLGADYTVPAHVDVPDHVDVPGKYVFDFVDRISSCEGFLHFETVGSPDTHNNYVKGKLDQLSRGWQASNIQVATSTQTVKLLEADGRETIFNLTAAADQNDRASAAYIDNHFGPQNLSVVAYAFCSDPGLLEQTVKSMMAIINSQKRP
ncbi:MAG: hypothetical protein ACOZIN_06780 [Myxococcota bacterium]